MCETAAAVNRLSSRLTFNHFYCLLNIYSDILQHLGFMETSGMVIPEVYIRWTEERVDDQKKEVRI